MADENSIIDLHILGAILQSQISNRMPHSITFLIFLFIRGNHGGLPLQKSVKILAQPVNQLNSLYSTATSRRASSVLITWARSVGSTVL